MTRKRYDRDFKQQAVLLVLEEGQKATSVARTLGIHSNMLSKWIQEYEEYGVEAFPGSGNLRPPDFEMKKLQKRIEELEMENEILKKFQAFLKNQKK